MNIVDAAELFVIESNAMQLVHLIEDAQPRNAAFDAWFGNSVVVDRRGQPLTVFHGSPDARDIWQSGFKTSKQRFGMGDEHPAFFFAADYRVAKSYADDTRAFDYQAAEPAVIDVYLKIENPLRIDWKGQLFRGTDTVIATAYEEGRDGVIISNVIDDYHAEGKPTTVYVVFHADQIKIIRGRS